LTPQGGYFVWIRLPAGLSGGTPWVWAATTPLFSLAMLASKGGPVLLAGMDPTFHCGQTIAYPAWTSAGCPALAGTCNFQSKIAGKLMAMPTALRGDANSVAVLGTYKPDATLSKSAYTAWATEVCNGFTATYMPFQLIIAYL
jgi:hypothetical protein